MGVPTPPFHRGEDPWRIPIWFLLLIFKGGGEEYYALTPERLELLDGYLCGGAEDHKDRLNLLRALAINEGLLTLVRLAPHDRWREALRRTYGPEA